MEESSFGGQNARVFTRSSPFPPWLNDQFHPGFNPADCSYIELTSDLKLYSLGLKFLEKEVVSSCRVKTKQNASETTKLLEQLAKEAQGDAALDEKKDEESEDHNRCNLTLGLGFHCFNFQEKQMWALHQTVGDPTPTDLGLDMFTSLVIFASGADAKHTLQELCNEWLRSEDESKVSGFFNIYRWNPRYQRWMNSGRRVARNLKTVILPETTKERIVNDIERFLSNKSLRWYFDHGIPYKRSYLFYGVPGCGKTSFIQALAGKFQRNLCFLQPMNPNMTDTAFKTCIRNVPPSSFIVIEDIDALFGQDRSKKHNDCPLTFSGLLNGLDGVGNPDGQIFILTTNFADQLDPALVRSGRVDLHVEFPLAQDEQIIKMFELFYPDSSELSVDFLEEVRESFPDGVSMASLQQHFIQQMFEQPLKVLDTVSELGQRLGVVSDFDARKEAEKAAMAETENIKDDQSMWGMALLNFDS